MHQWFYFYGREKHRGTHSFPQKDNFYEESAKSRTNESNCTVLTALKEAKHDDQVITVLLIKILDNYNKKVYKRIFLSKCACISRIINL